MERNTTWYDTLDTLLDDLDNQATNQQQPLQLARLNSTDTTTTTLTTLRSTSPLIIHDYDNDNFDFGAYDIDAPIQASSMDIEPLIVDFENDFI